MPESPALLALVKQCLKVLEKISKQLDDILLELANR